MIFKYKVTTPQGEIQTGTIDASSSDIALSSLQRRNLIVMSLSPIKKDSGFLSGNFSLFNGIKTHDMVVVSRQLSTLFQAKVPILSSFKLLAEESGNPLLRTKLIEMAKDIQGGANLSQSLGKHPDMFSAFYINMVRAGEESGKLEEVFSYMADYLERSFDLTSKAKRALVYPAFVVSAFIGVITLMLTLVIPKLGDIVKESAIEPPFYTKIVLGASDFLRGYGVFFLVVIIFGIFMLWRFSRTSQGKNFISRTQLKIPYLGDFYKKLYLSRVADNLETLITGGVSMVRALEISADTVGNDVYRNALLATVNFVKSGSRLSESFLRFKEIPGLVAQMVKIGEESGKLDFILKTLATYYRKEVDGALETLVNMIEPVMMLVLGAGVGLLLAAVLVPIYNIAMSV